jgi:peptidyl-dipeptidase Dcp
MPEFPDNPLLQDWNTPFGLPPFERVRAGHFLPALTHAGAALAPPARERLAEINAELATLTTRFAQNVLAEDAAFALVLRAPAELAGLPGDVREAPREATIGVFLADPCARATKRGGAWMSAYRLQSRSSGAALPIVVNNNFAKAAAGAPTLLSVDDLRTLFHEFGHGLHGLLSDVTYERLSGTQVLADFVELPSQIFEHWAFEPAVLARHARHHATGEPIPQALLDQLHAARQWNQGFETVEYTACALIDMALHARADGAPADLAAFESAEFDRLAMPREIVLRHRLPHFGHLFAGSSYAAGYYVYLWAEVLDADAYDAFAEAGDPFAPEVAARLRRCVYASGGTLDPAAAFRAFRGRDPRIEPMLRARGLVDAQPLAAAVPVA